MVKNGFYKRRQCVRHIGLPSRLIDYMKTVKFYTFKTAQSKKVKNADSKKLQSTKYLHKSRFFYIIKLNMHYFSTICGPA